MPAALPATPTVADDPLRRWRTLAPDRVALVDRRADQRLSWTELDVAADRWAGLLAGRGVGAGDRVGFLAGTRHEAFALFHGCLRLGAALVPLNWRLTAFELSVVVADARPAVLVGEGSFRALAESAVRQSGDPALHALAWIDLDGEAPRLLARERTTTAPSREAAPEEAALVLYTSGSTGRPKGAVLPRRQLHHNALATARAWELGSDDVAAVTIPLFHTGGWNAFATPLLERGGRIVLFDRARPEELLEGMAEEGVTRALLVPTQLAMLAECAAWGRPLPALRRFLVGGAPCPPAWLERARAAGYRAHEAYGLTEFGPNCFAIGDDEAVANPGAVGRPVPWLEARLLTADGHEAGVDEPGELQLRGPQLFGGYLFAPELTAAAFTADGWLHTGDLARRDVAGRFRICGRLTEMFISGGENVFPAEVEAALADCPGIADAVVIGVPDAHWGESGRAFVVPRPGCAPTAADILAHARTRLAGYKLPRAIVVLPSLPRLGSGKVDRRALAALQGDGPLARGSGSRGQTP